MAFTDTEIAQAHQKVREAGMSEDLYKLGLIYSTGETADLVAAHMWFNLAAARGSDSAKESRRELAMVMSAAEISTAQKQAREWLSVRHH